MDNKSYSVNVDASQVTGHVSPAVKAETSDVIAEDRTSDAVKSDASKRTASHDRTMELSLTAMFTAIILIMAFTPFGVIDLPFIKATILHVPVVIGALVLGPKKGAFFGFLFGLTSFIKNNMAPSVLSFCFTPFVPVIGTEHGSPWALFICFFPRIMVGVIPVLFYYLMKKLLPGMNHAVRFVLFAICGALAAFTNTALVMGSIYVLFKDAYAAATKVAVDAVRNVILGIVFGNGVPEMLVAAVIVPFVMLALRRAGAFKG